VVHSSDCAVNKAPAGPCNCGAIDRYKAQQEAEKAAEAEKIAKTAAIQASYKDVIAVETKKSPAIAEGPAKFLFNEGAAVTREEIVKALAVLDMIMLHRLHLNPYHSREMDLLMRAHEWYDEVPDGDIAAASAVVNQLFAVTDPPKVIVPPEEIPPPPTEEIENAGKKV
jgi:hypothetical protein